MEFTSTRPHFLKWGVILGIVLAAYSVILFATGMTANQSLGYVSYLIILGAIIMGMRDYKSENQGFMTFGKGVGLGTLLSLIGGTLSSFFILIYGKVINSGYYEVIHDIAIRELEEESLNNPQMNDEAMEMGIKVIETMTSPVFVFGLGIIGTLIAGVVMSLIVAAIMKQNPPEEMEG